LPFGAQSIIAKNENVHVTLVNRVINGKSSDPKILNAIADYLLNIKVENKKVSEKLAALID
jgi:hypothetical protein